MTGTQDIIKPEVKKPEPEAKVEKTAEELAADRQKADTGEKVGDLLGDRQPEEKMVPESVLLEFKNENKGLWTEIKKTQEMVAAGLSKKEVKETLNEIAAKYKTNPEFLKEVFAALKAETDTEVDKRITERVKPIVKEEKREVASTEKERKHRIFTEHFEKTIKALPDFKDIADAETVEGLTLLPENANKTFAQILEKAYGHLVKGKSKAMDSSQPGSRIEPASIDFDRAAKDSEYFKQIMADPVTRKEYNKDMAKRLKL